MPPKCSTYFNGEICSANYKTSTEKLRMFRFPKDEGEKENWIKSLPNVLTTSDTKNLGICERHWPKGYETTCMKGNLRIRHPFPAFPNHSPRKHAVRVRETLIIETLVLLHEQTPPHHRNKLIPITYHHGMLCKLIAHCWIISGIYLKM